MSLNNNTNRPQVGTLSRRIHIPFQIKQTCAEETTWGERGWLVTIYVYDRWLNVEIPSSVIYFVDYHKQIIYVYEDGIGPIIYEASKNVPR